MTFTVIWASHAEAQLASAWMQADDRESVTIALSELIMHCAANPIFWASRGVKVAASTMSHRSEFFFP